MKRPDRLRLVSLGLAAFTTALIVQAARVQLWQGRRWAERGRSQQFTGADLPAPRGTILDATGEIVAESREMVRLNVAPREVAAKHGIPRLRRALAARGFEADDIERAVDTRRAWVELRMAVRPGADTLASNISGVHAVRVMVRAYSGAEGLRRVVGHVSPDGPIDGIERSLEDLGDIGCAAGHSHGVAILSRVSGDYNRTVRSPVLRDLVPSQPEQRGSGPCPTRSSKEKPSSSPGPG